MGKNNNKLTTTCWILDIVEEYEKKKCKEENLNKYNG